MSDIIDINDNHHDDMGSSESHSETAMTQSANVNLRYKSTIQNGGTECMRVSDAVEKVMQMDALFQRYTASLRAEVFNLFASNTSPVTANLPMTGNTTAAQAEYPANAGNSVVQQPSQASHGNPEYCTTVQNRISSATENFTFSNLRLRPKAFLPSQQPPEEQIQPHEEDDGISLPGPELDQELMTLDPLQTLPPGLDLQIDMAIEQKDVSINNQLDALVDDETPDTSITPALAEKIEKIWLRRPMEHAKCKEMFEDISIPSNLKFLEVQKTNPEIWANCGKSIIHQDSALQNFQNMIGRVVGNLARQMDFLLNYPSDMTREELATQASQYSISALGHLAEVNGQLQKRRKEKVGGDYEGGSYRTDLIKFETPKGSKLLFGEQITKTIEDFKRKKQLFTPAPPPKKAKVQFPSRDFRYHPKSNDPPPSSNNYKDKEQPPNKQQPQGKSTSSKRRGGWKRRGNQQK